MYIHVCLKYFFYQNYLLKKLLYPFTLYPWLPFKTTRANLLGHPHKLCYYNFDSYGIERMYWKRAWEGGRRMSGGEVGTKARWVKPLFFRTLSSFSHLTNKKCQLLAPFILLTTDYVFYYSKPSLNHNNCVNIWAVRITSLFSCLI